MQNYKILLCEDIETYIKLEKIIANDGNNILIVSDSIQLKIFIEENDPQKKMVFLYGGETLFDVQLEANRMINEINDFFFAELSAEEYYICSWGKHFEGGAPQRIIDAMIYINTINRIFDEYCVEKVFCYNNDKNIFAKDIFEKASSTRDINFYRLGNKVNVKSGYRKHINFFDKEIEFHLPETVAFTAMQLFIYLKAIKLVFGKRCRERKSLYRIGICLDGKGLKHLIDAMLLQKAFNSFDNIEVTLVFSAEKAVTNIQNKFIESENVETYLTLPDLLSTAARHRRVKRKINFLIKKLQTENEKHLRFNDIDITDIVIREIKKFAEIDILRLLITTTAAKKYFNNKKFDAIKLFGTPNFNIARIYDWAISNSSLYSNKEKPMLFSVFTEPYAWGIGYETPNLISGDYLCYASKNILKYQCLLQDNNEFAVGSSRISNAYRSSLSQTRHISENTEDKTPISILLATGYPLTGYESTQDIYNLVDFIADFTLRNPEKLKLYVKPHPGDAEGVAEQLCKHKKTDYTIKLIDKKDSILDWIPIADIVVVSFSTVALEAMAMGKPVISMTSENAKRFNLDIGDAMIQLHDYEEFKKTMEIICMSRESYEQWSKQRIQKQNELLTAEFLNYNESPESMIVQSIIRKLKY